MTAKKQAAAKDDTYWRVLDSAIALDFKKGHQRWTLSELSRASGVTRSLIYYYFGSKKSAILADAVKFIGEEFFGLNENRLELWRAGKISESVMATRRLLENSPHLSAFYLAQRVASTEVGDSIRELEKEYCRKLQRFIPTLSEDTCEGIFGLFLGLTIAPKISDRTIERVVSTTLKEIQQNHSIAF